MNKNQSKLNETETESKYPEQAEVFEVFEEDEYMDISECKSINLIPKYANLEEEIMSLKISRKKYERTYNKTKTFLKSYAHPKYKTPFDGMLNNKIFNIKISWKLGELITVDELFVLMLVIDYDKIKYALAKCTEQTLSHIFHLRRQLFIVLNKYGSPHFGKHDKLYVPVTQQISTTGPVLATSSLTVSKIYTSEEGMTMAIIPQSNCWKAFDASKLSQYHKQLWLIDFVYIPIIKINTCQVKGSDNESSISICKI
eukprot:505536_1